MESSTGPENTEDVSRAPRSGLWLMIIIIVGLAAVAIFANVQKARIDRIEQVTVTPVSTATPAATRSR